MPSKRREARVLCVFVSGDLDADLTKAHYSLAHITINRSL
jgi:hypothetical protein